MGQTGAMAKPFVDYLTNEDVARIIAVGVMWRDLQEAARALEARHAGAVRALLPLLDRQSQAQARLAAADADEAADGTGLPPLPGTSPPGIGLGFAPPVPARAARLVEPETTAGLKARTRAAARASAEAADAAVTAGEARIRKLERDRASLLTDGLESGFYRQRRAKTEKTILFNVITYWPSLASALKGGFNPASAMQDDARLLASALGTLAAEVGVLFEPVSEMPSMGSRNGFPRAKQPYGSMSRDLRPYGNYDGRKDLGNAPFVFEYRPDSPLTMEEQFMVQSSMSDGQIYRGRGFVQMTGRGKYADFTARLAKVFADCDLVANPELANDARFAAEIFAGELKLKEPRILAALKAGDLIDARCCINGATKTRDPNGIEEFTGAWRATLIVLFEKIEAGVMDPSDAKRLLAQTEETDQAMRKAAAAGP